MVRPTAKAHRGRVAAYDPTSRSALSEARTNDDLAARFFDDDTGPTTVYYLHNTDHELLYVGITSSSRGMLRFREHAKSKEWWTQVAYASFEHFPSRVKAAAREASVIRALNPPHNLAQPAAVPSPEEYGDPSRLCDCGLECCPAGCPDLRAEGRASLSDRCAMRRSRRMRRERALS